MSNEIKYVRGIIGAHIVTSDQREDVLRDFFINSLVFVK